MLVIGGVIGFPADVLSVLMNCCTVSMHCCTVGQGMNAVLLEIDSLLSSVPGFLFGAWIQDAIALGTTAESRQQLVSSAKIQVTDWVGKFSL